MDDRTGHQAKALANFVWQIAETLRGDFKQSEYGKVILPFVVLRRLDCILEPSKEAVLRAYESLPNGIDEETRDAMIRDAIGGGIRVYNTSPLSFRAIRSQNPGDAHKNLVAYITTFSDSVRDVFLDKFLFTDQLKRLSEAAILWKVFEQFAALDLKPQSVSTLAMGYLFEDLIRRFSEISNETAGEHFTPREVIRLIVDLLLVNDAQALTGKGIIRQVYDAACGTGGMLALTEEGMKALNPDIRVELFGQELNGEPEPPRGALCPRRILWQMGATWVVGRSSWPIPSRHPDQPVLLDQRGVQNRHGRLQMQQINVHFVFDGRPIPRLRRPIVSVAESFGVGIDRGEFFAPLDYPGRNHFARQRLVMGVTLGKIAEVMDALLSPDFGRQARL